MSRYVESPAKYEGIYSVSRFFYGVFEFGAKRAGSQMKPGILVDPYPCIIRIWRQDLKKSILFIFLPDGNLVVAGCNVAFVREHPYLKEFDRFVGVLVVFAVLDAGTSAHHLDISFSDDGTISHAVVVLQVALQWDADDFHIIMRVGTEAHTPADGVIIQDAEGTEMHPLWVVVACEAERVVTFKPTVICLSPCLRQM